MNSNKIIVALDFSDEKSALRFCDQISPDACNVKVGKELFLVAGPKIVEKLAIRGFSVFLDLKFHDIPATVEKACKNAVDMGVWMMNVHASGGRDMLLAARSAVPKGRGEPLLLGVTVLTSLNQRDLQEIGFVENLPVIVNKLTGLAHDSGLDGVVCSADEASGIQTKYGDGFLRVTPGIRTENQSHDEQKRVKTPIEGIKNGSSFLVMGRPVTRSSRPMAVLEEINAAIKPWIF